MNPDFLNFVKKDAMESKGFYLYRADGDAMSELKTIYYATRGLPESCEHLDLEIVLNLKPDLLLSIIRKITENIKDGAIYEENKRYNNILKNKDIMFLKVKENDTEMLRVIFPDRNNEFDPAKMQSPYNYQYTTQVLGDLIPVTATKAYLADH